MLDIGSEDPDLLTIRAARIIRSADVILHDPSIAKPILELARRDAAKIKADAGNPLDWNAVRESLAGHVQPDAAMVYLRSTHNSL